MTKILTGKQAAKRGKFSVGKNFLNMNEILMIVKIVKNTCLKLRTLTNCYTESIQI